MYWLPGYVHKGWVLLCCTSNCSQTFANASHKTSVLCATSDDAMDKPCTTVNLAMSVGPNQHRYNSKVVNNEPLPLSTAKKVQIEALSRDIGGRFDLLYAFSSGDLGTIGVSYKANRYFEVSLQICFLCRWRKNAFESFLLYTLIVKVRYSLHLNA